MAKSSKPEEITTGKNTVKPTDKSVTQGTEGEQKAPSMPDPEIKEISREDPSLIKDLHDNTKEQEHFEQKPAAEIADIKTAVDASLPQKPAPDLPNRDTADMKIITSEIDGKETVIGTQTKDEALAEERLSQVAVNNANTAAADPTPIEKTIQKLNETIPTNPPKIDKDDKDAQLDEKIVKFLKSRATGEFIKLNDFLKSLYPVKKGNEPNVWENQGESKRLRVLLDNMKSHGMIDIQGNRHSALGTTYYTPEEQYARNHNLSTVDIYAKAI